MNDPTLGELEDFDLERAITLPAARLLLHGRRGPISLEVARRWIHPRKGCRVRADVPPLVLPAIRLAGQWLLMESWCVAFEAKRIELGRNAAGRLPRTKDDTSEEQP